MVFVLDKDNNPLMPCTPVIARLLLKQGKAKVKRRTPFTIKLKYDTTSYKQDVVAGMDTGSKTIGCAAVANGKVVYQAEVHVRQDVSRKMEQRKMYRRNRRSRKTRYRKARWLNRASSRREGRLAPSIRSKIESHLREKKEVEAILPVSEWKVETASFDIARISNPNIKEWGYQDGNQKGYYNLKAYILNRDGYKCQSGQRVKHDDVLEVHHIVFRSQGGTNSPDNLVTLCSSCHKALHAGEFELKGKRSKTRHATHMGVIKNQLKKLWNFTETFGFETKFKREQILQMPKSHANDAIAICCEEGELVEDSPHLFIKKHVSAGDYRQTNGKRSEKRIPTGKLFGMRKFDYIKTAKGCGFVKGKRSSGFFAISDVLGSVLGAKVNVKKDASRITARNTTLIQSFTKGAVASAL